MSGMRLCLPLHAEPVGTCTLPCGVLARPPACLRCNSLPCLFPRDFDANLYLCEEAFGLLPLNTFQRLSETLLFYAYVFVLLVTVITASVVAFHNLR